MLLRIGLLLGFFAISTNSFANDDDKEIEIEGIHASDSLSNNQNQKATKKTLNSLDDADEEELKINIQVPAVTPATQTPPTKLRDSETAVKNSPAKQPTNKKLEWNFGDDDEEEEEETKEQKSETKKPAAKNNAELKELLNEK